MLLQWFDLTQDEAFITHLKTKRVHFSFLSNEDVPALCTILKHMPKDRQYSCSTRQPFIRLSAVGLICCKVNFVTGTVSACSKGSNNTWLQSRPPTSIDPCLHHCCCPPCQHHPEAGPSRTLTETTEKPRIRPTINVKSVLLHFKTVEACVPNLAVWMCFHMF